MGCFRGSHFTKDQCKQLRNATDPLLLVKCDGYCKCFFCHHFSRAWVFDAFYSATLKFEQHGGLTHAKEYDNVKGNAIHSSLRNRPPSHLGSSFVSLARDAITLEAVALWPRVVRTDGSASAAYAVFMVAARRTRRRIDASPGRSRRGRSRVLFLVN